MTGVMANLELVEGWQVLLEASQVGLVVADMR